MYSLTCTGTVSQLTHLFRTDSTYLDKKRYCFSSIKKTMVVGESKVHHLEKISGLASTLG